MQANQAQGWHTAHWGMWGWIETILKLVAVVAGIAAFLQTSGDLIIGGHPHLAAVIVLALLTFAAIFQLVVRFTQRETISLAFAVVNLLGHLGLLVALLRAPEATTLPLIFGIFYTLGQVTKIQFLRVTGYTEGGADSSAMLRVTSILTVAYVVFTVLLVV